MQLLQRSCLASSLRPAYLTRTVGCLRHKQSNFNSSSFSPLSVITFWRSELITHTEYFYYHIQISDDPRAERLYNIILLNKLGQDPCCLLPATYSVKLELTLLLCSSPLMSAELLLLDTQLFEVFGFSWILTSFQPLLSATVHCWLP